MGLDVNGTKLLLYAKTQGVCFAKTAMIGRQRLYLSVEELRNNLSEFGDIHSEDEINTILNERQGYAEPFLESLGATEICSFDASNYENASAVMDLNFPIDEVFKSRFTVVLDGGTLEHIFNLPVAMKNCMEMVETGRHFLGITPTNNFLGHGFYQFSPELFFRIFCLNNGFELVRMIMFEDLPKAKWFEVTDPEAIKERVTLVNTLPTYLLIIAKKVASVQIFAIQPQQSDYVALWDSSNLSSEKPNKESSFSRVARKLYSFAPSLVKRSMWHGIRTMRKMRKPRYNPKFFRPVRVP